MAAYPAYPHAKVSSSYVLPFITYGSFVLNGASSPVVVGGAVESVRRLELGGVPFYRVRFSHPVPRINGARAIESSLQTTVSNTGTLVPACAIEKDLVDDGGDVRDDLHEFDFSVVVGVGPVDTAATRVDINMPMSQSSRQ